MCNVFENVVDHSGFFPVQRPCEMLLSIFFVSLVLFLGIWLKCRVHMNDIRLHRLFTESKGG